MVESAGCLCIPESGKRSVPDSLCVPPLLLVDPDGLRFVLKFVA